MMDISEKLSLVSVPSRRSSGHEALSPVVPRSARFSPSAAEASTKDSYLSELCTYSVERLNKEPELLRQEAEKLNRQIQDVSVDHYEAFLASGDCLKHLYSAFNDLQGNLRGFREKLPLFEEACTKFEHGLKTAQSKWKEKRKLQMNRATVLTLLEIPKLMETCVQNGNIDEALDLHAFVHRLSIHCGELSVIKSLRESSRKAKELVFRHLTEKLKSNIQLPDCLTAVGHLRRLMIYTERELRVCFLLCREYWISTIITECDDEQPFDYLKQMTDIHRLHLFDVVIQYKAVFATDRNEGEEGMLGNWALHRIECYLNILRSTLPKIKDGASLFSLLEGSMYCGMSLGRVGLDFRHLLISIFEPCLLSLFKTKLDGAIEAFTSQLENYRWLPTPVAGKSPNAPESNGLEDTNSRTASPSHTLEDLTPPVQLSQHLPLALFVNGYLSGLNELRHCTPLRGHRIVLEWIQDALKTMVHKFREYSVLRSLDSVQREVFQGACEDIKRYLRPYIVVTLDAIYPVNEWTPNNMAVLSDLDLSVGDGASGA